jgi:subtilisin family serine protease
VKRTAIALAAAAAALLNVSGAAAAATSYPNDYFFVTDHDQWGLGPSPGINAPAAWCASTGQGILVADIDTGANFGNPDLAGKLVAGAAFLGRSASDENSPSGTGQAAVQDDHGHGSMTTGIMVANTANGQGMAAVAPDAKALIVKVLGSDGGGYESDISYGIKWAANHGAQVINISIGPGEVIKGSGVAVGSSAPITQAIQYAVSKGVAVAVAAGNSGIPTSDYVALRQNTQAVIVGALGPSDTVAGYSNYGYGISVYAPGGDAPSQDQATIHNEIVSTWITKGDVQYAIGQGSSFAAPHVAGVLAQLMATGMSAAQAMRTVSTRTATSSDGFPQLDAALALGVSPSGRCGAPSSSAPVAPAGLVGPGGKSESFAPPPTQAPRTGTAPPAGQRTAAPVPASGHATPSPTADVAAAVATATADPAGHSGAPPLAGTSTAPGGGGGGGAPNPLVLASLAGVIAVGAPAAVHVARLVRRSRLPR